MPRSDLSAHSFATFIECFEIVYSNKGRMLNILQKFILQSTPSKLNYLLMVSEIFSERA